MGLNKTKVTGFRIENEAILEKLSYIAKKNMRTRNKEVEFALTKYVDEYERINGTITTSKDIEDRARAGEKKYQIDK